MANNEPQVQLKVTPKATTAGGVFTVSTTVDNGSGTWEAVWTRRGPSAWGEEIESVDFATETLVLDDGHLEQEVALDTTPLAVGAWVFSVTLTPVDKEAMECAGDVGDVGDSAKAVEVRPRPFQDRDRVSVTLNRAGVDPTPDMALWSAIRSSSQALSFDNYARFMDLVMCGDDGYAAAKSTRKELKRAVRRTSTPFPNVDRYRVLRAATEVFLMINCGVRDAAGDVEGWEEYLQDVPTGDGRVVRSLPYLALVRAKLGDVPVVGLDDEDGAAARACYGILTEKLENPCFLELIYSYWMDEAYLNHTINAICWRFQNRSLVRGRPDALAALEIDPLRPLSNYIWARIADSVNRTTTERRAFEYSHQYGVDLAAKPGRPDFGVDSQRQFIASFHHLLKTCTEFFIDDDDMTRVADGFAILHALKETHLHLSRGAHNQYGDVAWLARFENYIDQWLLARPEFSSFLPSRTMVVMQEPWMDRVDAMKKLQGWSDASVLHFRDLAVFGEQLLLGIRFGNWTSAVDPAQAANWARAWRAEIRQYIHSYRAVTGVDLTARADGTPPAYYLRQRAYAHR